MSRSWKRARREDILAECGISEQFEALQDELNAQRAAIEALGGTVAPVEAFAALNSRVDAIKARHPKPAKT